MADMLTKSTSWKTHEFSIRVPTNSVANIDSFIHEADFSFLVGVYGSYDSENIQIINVFPSGHKVQYVCVRNNSTYDQTIFARIVSIEL